MLDEVSDAAAAQILEHPELFQGVRVVAEMRRTYPAHDLAGHLVGARTKPTDADRSLKDGVMVNQDTVRIGRFGVEKSYSHRLNGVPGVQQTVRDRRQRIVSSEVTRKPVSGRDVVLTIDVKLQTLAEQLLAESLGDAERTLLVPSVTEESMQHVESEFLSPPEPAHIPVGGSVVIMEADSGRIAVAASAPDFDLSMFTDGSEAQWKAVNGDTRQPFVSRCTSMALPPGSTFKIVTAIAGLQTGVLTPEMPFSCRGYLSNPDEHRCLIYRLDGRGHDTVKLRSAMAQSCNVYFFSIGKNVGSQGMYEVSEAFGLGHQMQTSLPGESKGNIPNPLWKKKAGLGGWSMGDTYNMSIGQGYVTTTPMQMAVLVETVANRGRQYEPYFVERLVDASGQTTKVATPKVTRMVNLKESTWNMLLQSLFGVVENGTAAGTKFSHLDVRGKTGTAQNPHGESHAWFTGFAGPKGAPPQLAISVFLENGGSGGAIAVPVAHKVLGAAFPLPKVAEARP